MSALEESLLRRWPGLKIMVISAAAGLCGTLPLLLYIVFGPKNGNPIGLGLLAVVAVPIAAMGMFVGLVKFFVQLLSRRGT